MWPMLEFLGGTTLHFYIFVSLHFGDCFVKVLLMKRQGALLASWSFSQKERKKVELSKQHCGHYNDKWIWYRLQENIREKHKFMRSGSKSLWLSYLAYVSNHPIEYYLSPITILRETYLQLLYNQLLRI